MVTILQKEKLMRKEKLSKFDSKLVRDTVMDAIEKADQLLFLEADLVERLYLIDQKRFYLWFEFRSLQGFCVKALRLTRTQSQRIVTLVRRYEPTVNIEEKAHTYLQGQSEVPK